MWWRRESAEPVLTNEVLNGIIETLMRIDANVQTLLYGEAEDGEEAD